MRWVSFTGGFLVGWVGGLAMLLAIIFFGMMGTMPDTEPEAQPLHIDYPVA